MIGFGGGVGHDCLRTRPVAGGAVAVAGLRETGYLSENDVL